MIGSSWWLTFRPDDCRAVLLSRYTEIALTYTMKAVLKLITKGPGLLLTKPAAKLLFT